MVLYYLLGWLKRLFALIVIIYAAEYFLDVFGYQRLNTGDLFMSYEIPNRNHNIGGYFIMKKIEFEMFREEFYKRAVLNIRKLRQIQISSYGIKLWKDIDPKEAIKQLIKCDDIIKTQNDCINYSNKLMQEYMDYSKPLWEFHLVESYTEDLSVVIFRMHHSFSDGVGFVSLMSCINDDQFKTKINKAFKEPSLWLKIIVTIIAPFVLK